MSAIAPKQFFANVAAILRDNGFSANSNDATVVIDDRRYEIVAQGDRGYFWRNSTGKLSGGFTCDLYLSDGCDEIAEEVAEHLIHLTEDE